MDNGQAWLLAIVVPQRLVRYPKSSNTYVNPFIGTLKPRTIIQQYGDWYTGYCCNTFGTARRGLGGAAAAVVICWSMRPVYQLHIILCGATLRHKNKQRTSHDNAVWLRIKIFYSIRLNSHIRINSTYWTAWSLCHCWPYSCNRLPVILLS